MFNVAHKLPNAIFLAKHIRPQPEACVCVCARNVDNFSAVAHNASSNKIERQSDADNVDEKLSPSNSREFVLLTHTRKHATRTPCNEGNTYTNG